MAALKAVLLSLESQQREAIEGWRTAAQSQGCFDSRLVDGPPLNAGFFVAENLFDECGLDVDCTAHLLGALTPGGPFEGQFTLHVSALNRRPTAACQPLEGAALFRMINSIDVLREASEANYIDYPMPPSGRFAADPGLAWREFMTCWQTLSADACAEFLGRLRLGRAHRCWAFVAPPGFVPARAMADASRLYDRLGLHWAVVEDRRQRGAMPSSFAPLALLLEYTWHDVRNADVPTIADAGWAPRFAPAPEGAGCGRTLDRRGHPDDPQASGLDEIVHDSRDGSCVRGNGVGLTGTVA